DEGAKQHQQVHEHKLPPPGASLVAGILAQDGRPAAAPASTLNHVYREPDRFGLRGPAPKPRTSAYFSVANCLQPGPGPVRPQRPLGRTTSQTWPEPPNWR